MQLQGQKFLHLRIPGHSHMLQIRNNTISLKHFSRLIVKQTLNKISLEVKFGTLRQIEKEKFRSGE